MEILYLGTSACEGVPSMYCKCPVCTYARKHKGKELRSRSSFAIDGKLFIDFSPDTYLNTVKRNLIFGEVEHLLITHCDADHYYVEDLVMRYLKDKHDGIPQKLHIYGNENVGNVFKSARFYSEENLNFADIILLKRNITQNIGGYEVTPFYTEHLLTEESFVYLIRKDGKAYLHLVDSPVPPQTVFDKLDCTFGSMTEEFGGHMNLWQNVKVKKELEKIGAADGNTKFVATHISHFGGTDTYKSLRKIAAKNGITLAYDGLRIKF